MRLIKINQIEIKNIQNTYCSAILSFGKPLKTIVANFITKWINYSRNMVSSDLKGFLQGLEHSNKITKMQEFKITKFQGYKDTRILIYFAVSLDL